MSTILDLGHDHTARPFTWSPDRELNPHYADWPDVPIAGYLVDHPALDPDAQGALGRGLAPGERCSSAITLDVVPELHPLRRDDPARVWHLVAWHPLEVEPSLLCRRCGDHGHIRGGLWVPA